MLTPTRTDQRRRALALANDTQAPPGRASKRQIRAGGASRSRGCSSTRRIGCSGRRCGQLCCLRCRASVRRKRRRRRSGGRTCLRDGRRFRSILAPQMAHGCSRSLFRTLGPEGAVRLTLHEADRRSRAPGAARGIRSSRNRLAEMIVARRQPEKDHGRRAAEDLIELGGVRGDRPPVEADAAEGARGWTCRRVSQSVPCGHRNPPRTRKCRQQCGKPRPARRRPAHLQALDADYAAYVELNGGNRCGILRPPTVLASARPRPRPRSPVQEAQRAAVRPLQPCPYRTGSRPSGCGPPPPTSNGRNRRNGRNGRRPHDSASPPPALRSLPCSRTTSIHSIRHRRRRPPSRPGTTSTAAARAVSATFRTATGSRR